MKIALVGAKGRMGQELERLVRMGRKHKVVEAHPSLPAGAVDVVIDFSSATGAVAAAKWCVQNRVPLVSGSTGLSQVQIKKLHHAAKKIPVLWSPNMSLGILVFRRALAELTVLGDWTFQIEELHHGAKKDSPSGTAKLLQADLAGQLGRKPPPVLAARGGSVAGIHKVWALGAGERIELTHVAESREIFARGALVAAEWLVTKRPGWYDFSKVISL